MTWTRETLRDGLIEWSRADGHATVRLRERADGRYVVRLDRLKQASDGTAYRRVTVEDRAVAMERAEELRADNELG